MLGIALPIVRAGTGSIATARLAAAVTNAGGLGMTGAAGDASEQVDQFLVCSPILGGKSRNSIPEVVFYKRRMLVNLSG